VKHLETERSPLTRSIVVCVAAAVIGAAPIAGAQDSAHKTAEAWQIIQLPQSSLVFARDSSLIGEIGHQMRTSVSLKSLPAYVSQAFVAIEDQRSTSTTAST
jgi:Membrane carboxypeptidase/penicillin-binding protein